MIQNKNKAIITSCSNKFVPSLLNFLGSIKRNYPNHPDVYIYDLGISKIFLNELNKMEWVHLLKVPPFVSHWRACYTWKTYILNNPICDLNLYIDAGSEILISLDPIFEKIEERGCVFVSQGDHIKLKEIWPEEYNYIQGITKETLDQTVITAGIVGFAKDDSAYKNLSETLFKMGIDGLCLGYSPNDAWKNKGVNKNNFVRQCPLFRHDTSLLSALIRTQLSNPYIYPVELFSPEITGLNQFIRNFRLNYSSLQYVKTKLANRQGIQYILAYNINRIFYTVFIVIKKINKLFKDATR